MCYAPLDKGVSSQELNQSWFIFPLMSFVEATELWQEGANEWSRSSTHFREKATNQFVCPWCFKLMITPWCKGGQSSLCLLMVIHTPHFCPLMFLIYKRLLSFVKSSFLFAPFFSNLISSSTLFHCHIGTIWSWGSRDTWILLLFHLDCSPSRVA